MSLGTHPKIYLCSRLLIQKHPHNGQTIINRSFSVGRRFDMNEGDPHIVSCTSLNFFFHFGIWYNMVHLTLYILVLYDIFLINIYISYCFLDCFNMFPVIIGVYPAFINGVILYCPCSSFTIIGELYAISGNSTISPW